ncbi:MAG: ABC transporter substrate-binding protein [Paracoccaceae bacterium]
MTRTTLFCGAALGLWLGAAAFAADITVADDQGVTGAYPNQLELSELEAAGHALDFTENPAIGELNARIHGNPDSLPPVAERLPEEPLVIMPYEQIGTYGGVLDGLSNATEAGTSDVLSLRHVNLVRFADDTQTLVPNIAKAWAWNDDFTVLTITLRRGHKWSNGEAFTAEDIEFWYNDLILNENVYESTPSAWLWDGKPAEVVALDDVTVQFTLPVPAPGLMGRFAVSYAQPFQPKHFLGQFMEKHAADAVQLREDLGFASESEAINWFYGGSDWKDVPSPLLKDAERAMRMPAAVVPTLESHIVVEDTAQGRRMVANPFFHQVDTAGNQLPYINEINELYVPEKEVRNLKIVNGEVDYKMQTMFLADFPLYKENEGQGDYTVHLTPTLGEELYYAFNVDDPEFGELFDTVEFRRAMSHAIDREEVLDLVYLGQGRPIQATPAEPGTVGFLTEEHLTVATEFDPDLANRLLDEAGATDTNGDGVREWNGKDLTLQMFYANQGGPVRAHELVRGYWEDVGVVVNQREISSDDYRAKGQANELTISSWRNGNRTGVTLAQDPFMFYPPFGDRWQPGVGFDWAAWLESDGAAGREPPEAIKTLFQLAQQFQALEIGSPESNEIGKQVADIHAENLWKIGVVGETITPVVTSNKLGNFKPFTSATYDYYWAYPYAPTQWYLTE